MVHPKPPFAGSEVALKYLARYTHRVAISDRRLLSSDDGAVRFSYNDYAQGGQQREMTLDSVEFLRRFLLHVCAAPKGPCFRSAVSEKTYCLYRKIRVLCASNFLVIVLDSLFSKGYREFLRIGLTLLGSGSSGLGVGRQSLTLSFNGEKIGAHAVDGPYRVADLSIQGSEGILLRSMVTETAGYTFTAFQGASGPPGPGTPPQINSGGIVDAAAFQPTVSAGGIASLFGLNLAAHLNVASSIPLPTDLSGVRVRVDDIAALLFFVSPAQVNFQIPVEAPSSGDAHVVVVRNGLNSPPQTAPFAPAAPAVFVDSNTRQAIALTNPEGVLVTAQNPAASGDILTVFLTGLVRRGGAGGAADGAVLLDLELPDGGAKRLVTRGTRRTQQVLQALGIRDRTPPGGPDRKPRM